MSLYRDAPGFDEYTDEEYHRALQAPLGAVCVNCPHTKVQHYAAGPRCMVCDCHLFIAPREMIDEIPLGYGDVVQVWPDGALVLGNVHRHYARMVLSPKDMWRLRKALKKAARALERAGS